MPDGVNPLVPPMPDGVNQPISPAASDSEKVDSMVTSPDLKSDSADVKVESTATGEVVMETIDASDLSKLEYFVGKRRLNENCSVEVTPTRTIVFHWEGAPEGAQIADAVMTDLRLLDLAKIAKSHDVIINFTAKAKPQLSGKEIGLLEKQFNHPNVRHFLLAGVPAEVRAQVNSIAADKKLNLRALATYEDALLFLKNRPNRIAAIES
jgi:hypothetical protein